MENQLQIFENELELKKISLENEYMGVFYAVEYGNLLKIGSTTNPYRRIMTFKREAEKYGNTKIGKIAISKQHTNYIENEKKIHALYKESRKSNLELFNISIKKFIADFRDFNLEYKNDKVKIEEESTNFCNMMKTFISGGKSYGQ